jgi:glycosyltransferase involved in cell wall biosynthesis
MKILWFTETSTLYDDYENHYFGCGWTESLQQLLTKVADIELSVAFFHPTDKDKLSKSDVTYYPIVKSENKNNPVKKLLNNWTGNAEVYNLQVEIDKIISDSKPDIIHVFGTEGAFSNINTYTAIPVVFHLQGLINPCLNTYLPINQSKFSFYFNFNYLANNIKGNSPAFELKRFLNQAKREAQILKSVRYVMGRTTWDKTIVTLFNPKVHYFDVDEVLRSVFYERISSNFKEKSNVFRIVSTLSPTVYKGIDVVLKTAKVLKELTTIDFQWEIIGLDSNSKLLKHFEKSENIKHQEVNIVCIGRKNSQQLVECLQNADVYVHPSYIDNSPNSICEAQIIGLPVVACNVGGVSSLVEHSFTGYLVPSNGVFEITNYLKILFEDEELRCKVGKQAKDEAMLRHSTEKIIHDVLNVYKIIINAVTIENND